MVASIDLQSLDHLAGDRICILGLPNLIILLALGDSHSHLIRVAERNRWVQSDKAHSIAGLLHLIREQSINNPPMETGFRRDLK